MEEKIYKITLDDGTVISGLRKNGDNFISSAKITESVFEDNLAVVKIDDGEREETHSNMDLVQITQVGNEYWFVLRDITAEELVLAKLRADIDYVGMMADVPLF